MPDISNQDVLTLLEEFVGLGRPLRIELNDGRRFVDGVCDVRRLCGEDFVTFYANNQVIVSDIVRAERFSQTDDPGL